MRRLAATLPVALLSACTLLVDVGGLRDGDASAPDESGTPPVNGDGGSNADGATGDAPSGTSPCAAAHTFCDDFDTGDDNLATRWDQFESAAGPLALDTKRSRSAPHSLRMDVKPTTGHPKSRLVKAIPVANGTARVEVDLFMPSTVGSYGEIDPIGVQLHPTPAGYAYHGLYVGVRPEKTFFQYFAEKSGARIDNRVPISFSMDAWHHVVITFSYATMRATVSIDGAVASVALGGPTATKLDLELGAGYTENADLDWSFNYDNAFVDTP